MDFQNRVGSKVGSGGVASASESNRQRRERLRALIGDSIDLNQVSIRTVIVFLFLFFLKKRERGVEASNFFHNTYMFRYCDLVWRIQLLSLILHRIASQLSTVAVSEQTPFCSNTFLYFLHLFSPQWFRDHFASANTQSLRWKKKKASISCCRLLQTLVIACPAYCAIIFFVLRMIDDNLYTNISFFLALLLVCLPAPQCPGFLYF